MMRASKQQNLDKVEIEIEDKIVMLILNLWDHHLVIVIKEMKVKLPLNGQKKKPIAGEE